MIRGVIFDFDGLILDTEGPEFASVSEVFREHGLDLSLDWWRSIVGSAEHQHWFDLLSDRVGRPLDRDEIVAARRRVHHGLIEEQDVRPGVVDILDAAEARGRPVGVASSSDEWWVDGHLTRLGLRGRFDHIRCGDHVERTKPWPDVFLAAAEAIGVDPVDAVVFEDSAHGVNAARAAGVGVIVACPNPITEASDFTGADAVVPSLAALDLAALLDDGSPRLRPTPS